MEYRITDDLDKLRSLLPDEINTALDLFGHTDNLLEVVLDLGRVPTARYVDGEAVLAEDEITTDDLELIEAGIGDFDADNRAGIERTLHRISAIRNRRGEIVGLTCRVGRAVYGTIDIIQDLVTSGQSVLLLGPPGVGKTTMLREAARVLAESRRVVIVDTSNEIGGDGDVPHPAVGKARRMQVAQPDLQHEVMIEAVENHNPEVIVIDEIGRALEAMAARTIAERGVQLIATAHGNTLNNLLLNPTLSDLVGGIESVTLSDEEARRRGTQKTVLERRAPSTFDVLIEIQTRNQLVVHEDVAAGVDALLRSRPLPVEIRTRDEHGEIHVESAQPDPLPGVGGERAARSSRHANGKRGKQNGQPLVVEPEEAAGGRELQTLRVYAYGVARNRLHQAAKRLNVPLIIMDDFDEVDAVVTLKNHYRQRPRLIVDAERVGMPIYVLRANTVSQMETFLVDLFNLEAGSHDPFGQAIREAKDAIKQIRGGGMDSVDLAPQNSTIRKRQHQMASKAQLISDSYGDEPQRFVRIFRNGEMH